MLLQQVISDHYYAMPDCYQRSLLAFHSYQSLERRCKIGLLCMCSRPGCLYQSVSQVGSFPLKPQIVAHNVDKLLEGNAMIITDMGTVTTWAARHIQMRGEMQFSASGMLATMANGLPYSIGAAIANPGRQIVCLAGDGGFSMLMAEVATLVK